jgi:transposase
MEAGSIFFALAMLILVGAYLAGPLSEPTSLRARKANGELSALIAERERLLDAIQELDADLSLGKVEEDGYLQQRHTLALQGAHVLRRIDELGGADSQIADLEAELEAEIAKLRGQPASFCTHCGKGVHASDRFCGNCGAELEGRGA